MKKPKVLVCQHGARHRYAIPRMLEKNGMLCALYTDSSASSLAGKWAARLNRVVPSAGRAVSRREIRGVDPRKIYSSDFPRVVELLQRLIFVRKQGIQLFRQRHRLLSLRMRGWGMQQADMVYSMYYENLDFIRWAKQQGLKSVVDVYISPVTDRIMEQEHAFFPDWTHGEDKEAIALKERLWREVSDIADLLVCPSEWVAQGVRSTTPEASRKLVVVPYGCSINYDGVANLPVKGRILFAGRDPLRKGLNYLAQATTLLKSTLPELDVRVAGEMSTSVVNHPICREMNFLGQMNGKQMKEEFLSADALVLPALSEGFAAVVAEAIGAGCPVIVTKEAGSPVVHEREGLIIQSRDTEALADAMRRMVLDRDLRDRCAKECLAQVSFYSQSMWEKRLLNALGGCLEV